MVLKGITQDFVEYRVVIFDQLFKRFEREIVVEIRADHQVSS